MPFNLGMDEQTWYFYTTGYYSETRANDLLVCTTPWMELKCLVLNGREWRARLTSDSEGVIYNIVYERDSTENGISRYREDGEKISGGTWD